MTTENSLQKVRSDNPLLKRLARISAWVLLILIILLVVSGWGITQTGVIYKITFGLVDRGLANSLHREINTPLAFFFLAHVGINIKLMIARNHPALPWLTNIVLIVIGLGIMAIVIYMEYYRLGG